MFDFSWSTAQHVNSHVLGYRPRDCVAIETIIAS